MFLPYQSRLHDVERRISCLQVMAVERACVDDLLYFNEGTVVYRTSPIVPPSIRFVYEGKGNVLLHSSSRHTCAKLIPSTPARPFPSMSSLCSPLLFLSALLFLTTTTPTCAWVAPTVPQQQLRSSRSFARLAASVSTSTSNSTEPHQGRLLEGGKVIDFGAVKASSAAEEALANARHGTATIESSSAILGINQDVVDAVGHPLGTFATPEIVQACAAALRARAAPGLLETAANPPTTKSIDDATVSSIMAQAYTESGEVTSAFAKTFFMGTMLLGEAAREAIWAVYVWCRRTDEIVDAPREKDEDMLTDLSAWEERLERLWSHGEVRDVFDLCLLDVRIQYPTMSIQPFRDMIRGMLMDVPRLGQERYETFDELHLYCYRVAGTVGVMSLPVFGCAEGYDDDIAR